MNGTRLPPWERDERAAVAPPWDGGGPPRTLAAQLSLLWRTGGWDGRLSPADAWRRQLGDVPLPSPAELATEPTFGPLDSWIGDANVTDVQLNGPDREILIRRAGDTCDRMTRETWHPDWIDWVATQLTLRGQGTARYGMTHGTADARRPGYLPCQLRYDIVGNGLCPHGPAISIRVLRPESWSLERLIELGTLTRPAAELAAKCMRAGVDVFIAGPAGAGKSSLMQALLHVVGDLRVICVEEVCELLAPSPSMLQLVCTIDGDLGLDELTLRALRFQPQRLVIGDLRGSVAYAALAAARNGYPILTSVYGDSARHALHNVITMALEARASGGQADVVASMLNARPSLIIALAIANGRRHVAEIVEVERQFGGHTPVLQNLFVRRDGALTSANPPSSALARLLAQVAGGSAPSHDAHERQ